MAGKVKVRIKLVSTKIADIKGVLDQIEQLSKLTNSDLRIIPLPQRNLNVSTRRTPCGDGSDTYEHWQMRFFKRLIELVCDEKVLRQLLRVRMPDNVQVKLRIA